MNLEDVRKQCEEADPRPPSFEPTWSDRPEFTGRRVIVARSNVDWNDIYIFNYDDHTAEFTGHQMIDAGSDAPLHDHDVGYFDSHHVLHVLSGPHRGPYICAVENRW